MASIKKRVTAKGEVRWKVRLRVDGQILHATRRTRAAAEQWARETEDAARAGELVDPALARQTVAEYGAGWLAGRRLQPRTKIIYEDLLVRRIGPDLGGVQLRHLTPEKVRQWFVAQPDGPYTAKAYRLLRSICATAVDDGVLRRQPCRIKDGGKESSPERPLVTPDQIAALIDAAIERAQAPILVAAWLGVRRGELLALERRDFNLLHGKLRVERSVQWIKGQGRTELPPKTDAGHRELHMPRFVADAVEVHLAKFVESGPRSPFVVGVSKVPASPRMLWRWWDDARKATGLQHLHFHDLRHAAGTMAAQTGATSAEIQAHLGHSSRAAADRYQHVAASRQAELAEALDALQRGELPRGPRTLSRAHRAHASGTEEAQESS